MSALLTQQRACSGKQDTTQQGDAASTLTPAHTQVQPAVSADLQQEPRPSLDTQCSHVRRPCSSWPHSSRAREDTGHRRTGATAPQ